MSDVLFLDIETCQATKENVIKDIRDNIKPPKTIKLQKSIDAWNKDKRGQAELDAISKTSFDGFAGEVISIGFAVNNEPVECLYRNKDESEYDLLVGFFDYLTANYGVNFNPLIVAHNISFDCQFLYKRCVVNQVKPSIDIPRNPKPWDKRVFCTMHESVGDKPGGSLNRISNILGLGQKTDGICGAEMNQAWIDGRKDKIMIYNIQDVELCRGIYKRLLFIDKIGD